GIPKQLGGRSPENQCEQQRNSGVRKVDGAFAGLQFLLQAFELLPCKLLVVQGAAELIQALGLGRAELLRLSRALEASRRTSCSVAPARRHSRIEDSEPRAIPRRAVPIARAHRLFARRWFQSPGPLPARDRLPNFGHNAGTLEPVAESTHRAGKPPCR